MAVGYPHPQFRKGKINISQLFRCFNHLFKYLMNIYIHFYIILLKIEKKTRQFNSVIIYIATSKLHISMFQIVIFFFCLVYICPFHSFMLPKIAQLKKNKNIKPIKYHISTQFLCHVICTHHRHSLRFSALQKSTYREKKICWLW